MRLLIARCSVEYRGRLSARLDDAVRLIMVKADGSVSVHSDGRAYKPLNWMSPPTHIAEGPDRWTVTGRSGEELVIDIAEVISDTELAFGEEPGLVKDGVEAELQLLLAGEPSAIEPGLTLVCREHETGIGPVDLLCRDAAGGAVAVEVKRRGDIDGVEQLTRYLARLELDARLRPVRGVLVAQQVKPQARRLAEDRGIGWVEVDYDRLRGAATAVPSLFDLLSARG